MKNNWLKKAAPFLAALFIFLSITVVYFSPLFEGQKLKQHDIAMYKGMSKEIVDFRDKTGQEPLWTNSMFGGMPAWQISVIYKANLFRAVDKILRLDLPPSASYVFLYFLGFFVLLLVLRVDPWLSIVGAIAFALSSYFFIILGAGHTSKAHAIGYMAPVLAGIILTYRGKLWPGALLTAVALSLEIIAGHLQITYYLLILVVIYGVYQLIKSWQEKQMAYFVKATLVLLAAAGIAVAVNITPLWGTAQYGKYTMRGKPVLTKEKENKSSGLDRDYITAWSYGIGETWSLMIPDVKGGASGYIGFENKALDKADPNFRRIIAQQNAYWGNQPGTSGPVYVGAIIVFLFVLGMFILDDKLKWALFAATVIAILFSWGKNFMGLTNLLIDYLPGYNKFRAVSMILVIAELTIPLLAILTLNRIIKEPGLLLKRKKAFLISLGLTAGLGILFYLFPDTFFTFFSKYETQQFARLKLDNNPAQVTLFINSLKDVRIAIFRADVLRSMVYILLGAAALYLFALGKLKKGWFLMILGVLILADLAGVDHRYLNDNNFEPARKAEKPFQPTVADRYVFRDKTPDFRVLDLTKNVFNDASTSYFHFSIGGYHGAKLQRYQDLIDEYLMAEITDLRHVFASKPTPDRVEAALQREQVLNMLNTKYIIYNPKVEPILNTYAFGNAWPVQSVKMVKNADEAIAALGKTDLHSEVVVVKQFAGLLQQKQFPLDASAQIKLVSYAPNHLVYDFQSKAPQLVVFSEIYYPKGWKAFIDGKESPYFRADYLLRAMVVPAGHHQIVFTFSPKAWKVGETISLIASLVLLLLLAVYLFYTAKKVWGKPKK
ncbi:YfhO family protein [Candidatus Sulfidibacterium hydrothermale]|uniref:YfhO family protein n=1 Tax=Candidatus Sulfidibacterium hydrothermale TaxID=2875962 RepID=UPI001F0B2B82|nr:YfhO family protein [Candidatus Sulfidibacterium hydrothermale]UBM61665.1 YfhO family protein [Candidatus Sulfidibacterium hydrothermale]